MHRYRGWRRWQRSDVRCERRRRLQRRHESRWGRWWRVVRRGVWRPAFLRRQRRKWWRRVELCQRLVRASVCVWHRTNKRTAWVDRHSGRRDGGVGRARLRLPRGVQLLGGLAHGCSLRVYCALAIDACLINHVANIFTLSRRLLLRRRRGACCPVPCVREVGGKRARGCGSCRRHVSSISSPHPLTLLTPPLSGWFCPVGSSAWHPFHAARATQSARWGSATAPHITSTRLRAQATA